MLTRKQSELLRFIHERLQAEGVPPSFDEMKDALDLKSKSGIHRLIMALEERGFIRRLANRARAIEVLRLPESATDGAFSWSLPSPTPTTPAKTFISLFRPPMAADSVFMRQPRRGLRPRLAGRPA